MCFMALFDCECLCVICSGIGIGVYSTKKEGECSKMCSQVDTGGFHPWTYPCLLPGNSPKRERCRFQLLHCLMLRVDVV